MTMIVQIHKSQHRKPSAHDYDIYTPDIDHGIYCRCTEINPSTVKRGYHRKKKEQEQEQVGVLLK
jgi:hypothetical protein